jgi:hypothetical protein
MASANVEVVMLIIAANERGDYRSTEWAHPDIEFVVADGPSPGRSTGVAGMTEGWLDMANAFEHLSTEADEYRELDGGRALVLVRRSGRGKASGLELGGDRVRGSGPVLRPRRRGHQTGRLLGPPARVR